MAAPRIVGPRDGHKVFLGGADARFLVDGDDTGDIASPLSSIRCGRGRLARPCTGTTARTNTVSYLREQWVRSLATRSSSVIPVT